MSMIHFYKDHIDTDVIIPARYLNVSDADILKDYCMIDIDPSFAKRVSHGDYIVAGYNFGCGSSREHAPIAIKASGVSCVIAKSFARIFFRNALNIGLPVIESEKIASEVAEGDQITIRFKEGILINETQNITYQIPVYPPFMMGIIEKGGLVEYTKARSANE